MPSPYRIVLLHRPLLLLLQLQLLLPLPLPLPLPWRRYFEASLAVPHSAQRIITDNRYQLRLEALEALDLSPHVSLHCAISQQLLSLIQPPIKAAKKRTGGPPSSMDMGKGYVGLWSEG